MKISGYDINFDTAVKTIKDKGYKKIVLQVPGGLKSYALKFVDFFEKETNAEVIISADACFGACDLVDDRFRNLGVDFAVQIGHTSIPSVKDFSVPTVFVNAKSTLELKELINNVVLHLKKKKIGLVTTAQHIYKLDEIRGILEENSFEVIIGNGDDRIKHAGQILGCNFSAANSVKDDVDMFLYVGSGNFHPLGLILSTKKPVVVIDPYSMQIRSKELEDLKDSVLRQRYGAIARSKDAYVFGVLAGVKHGQQRVDLVDDVCEKLVSCGKKYYVLAVNFFSPGVIESFKGIDCFVSTGCPRIAIDDYMSYKIPIVTPVELEILLGFRKWENYCFDEF